MKLLVVEDDSDLRSALVEGLRHSGYAVDEAENGEDALFQYETENYDLMILDLNLPERDGFSVLEKIREADLEFKVLILSARNQAEDKVRGLDVGANDYLTKPFDFIELEARIRNLLRRQFIQEKTDLEVAGIKMSIDKNQVLVNETELKLTKKEFSILRYLLMTPNKVVSQEELISHVWDSHANQFSSSIRVHIASLRKKLKEQLGYDVIGTKVGVGYYLVKETGEEHV
ncbi:response regulator transcription factor [Brochothrix thermosphacta]|uniref:DNA-binding response regulator n=2 Tax=Brochothrix thermosphacta TaxID=2756 RepID=A0A1D2L6E0_BROTH|nr:response regulator transcription factor [Brochothrix thermosphacta]ATF27068.1 DNA-binding response regulator [Brochothrix thermosphacta]ATH86426.1 DNA-binding response regulator [Brochothrix thermosphacta]EUJ36082.1 two component transcriptional regulator [Brochothrix thermosphacta DSM 20171 = FSL F6-1036]MPQ28003.1 response regulator transcription factor [Brochothrix thermosphacta]ODJ50500.1 DNA-binding response regulator [Brochothrix thermosphacta DSM 20171 = FSL F6-1036]